MNQSPLALFLLDRFTEDEQYARACHDWSECSPMDWEAEAWRSDPSDKVSASDNSTYGCEGHPSVARQLADVDAKRRVVQLASDSDEPGLIYALQILSLPYVQHPDYPAPAF